MNDNNVERQNTHWRNNRFSYNEYIDSRQALANGAPNMVRSKFNITPNSNTFDLLLMLNDQTLNAIKSRVVLSMQTLVDGMAPIHLGNSNNNE